MKRKNTLEKVMHTVIVGSVACLVLGFSSLFIKSININKINKAEYIIKSEDRLPYDYLKSVTVYIINTNPVEESLITYFDDETNEVRAVGTGTVIADKDGYFYIMTNKHVCNEKTVDNCWVSLTGDRKDNSVRLTFVRQAKTGVDLSLWKIENTKLPKNKSIKGLNVGHPQDKVFSVGQYLANAFIYAEGTMAGYDSDNESEIFNLPSAPGCSGSGIFNIDGELIAVLYAGNVVPLARWPIGGSMDTSKALAVSGKDVKEFIGDLI